MSCGCHPGKSSNSYSFTFSRVVWDTLDLCDTVSHVSTVDQSNLSKLMASQVMP